MADSESASDGGGEMNLTIMHPAYAFVSGTFNMMMTAVEKKRKAANLFHWLRSKIKRVWNQMAAEPPPIPVDLGAP
jgi:hypothetical protein